MSEEHTTTQAAGEPSGRRKRSRAKVSSTEVRSAPPSDPSVEFAPWDVRGSVVRVNHRRAARGFYAPSELGAPTSTRQAEVLNTTAIGAPTDEEGIPVGEDVLSRTIVAHDPFTAYEKGLISSPNVVAVGDVGSGKSSLGKTCYVLRPLALRDRRVVVFDRKDKGGRGEYAELTERHGSTPITFSLEGGGSIINLLDPVVAQGSGWGGTFRLLRTVLETAEDRQLDTWEVSALRIALRATLRAAETGGRQPTISDLLTHLPTVADDRRELSAQARERLHQDAVTVMFLVEGLLEEHSGLFDGETTPGISLSDRLTSFDTSQLPATGPAAQMVVATAYMWLMGVLRAHRGMFTYTLAEEGWEFVDGSVGRLVRSNVKLARGLGNALVSMFHKLADYPPGTPAYAIVQEAQTVHLFRQEREDAQRAALAAFKMHAISPQTVGSLRTGHHLFKVGSRPPVHVRAVRTDLERSVTDTDEAMTRAGRRTS